METEYRVRVEVYVADDPEAVILKEDLPILHADDIEAAAGMAIRHLQRAISRHQESI